MSTHFKTTRDQDAAPIIRGFLYQIYQTIHLWLRLDAGQHLELERGEDIDVVAQQLKERNLIQVKDLQQNITLRTPDVINVLFN